MKDIQSDKAVNYIINQIKKLEKMLMNTNMKSIQQSWNLNPYAIR